MDLDPTEKGIVKWLRRCVIPKNRAFVDEILKSLGLNINNTKGIIDVSKELSLNDRHFGNFGVLWDNRGGKRLSVPL